VTLSEAIRTLSTELIAGKGPDVFVLDGLPVESYIQKDVLLDMASALEEVKGDLLPNAANAFKTGDSLYAIPTRVSVPILVGVGVEEIGSLDEFVTWLENQPEKRIGLSNDVIMEQFYPICAVNWFGADGTLDTAAVTADLTDLERFARLSDIVNIGGFSGHSATPIENYTITDILSQAMFWSGEGFAAICGRLSRLEDASPIFSAMDVRGAGSIIPFPAGENGCIIPSGVLGVNAAGGQTEAALDFVRFALEAETQKSSLNTGMSINRSALEAIATSRKAGDFIDSGAVAYDAEQVFALSNYWPTEEQMQGVIEMIASANAVSPHDAIIKQIVLEETAGLFTGDRTVEEVVQALTQKVERNLQE
jgi:ABC-type glycerol-3-phosphate transport system substrate-binding protein